MHGVCSMPIFCYIILRTWIQRTSITSVLCSWSFEHVSTHLRKQRPYCFGYMNTTSRMFNLAIFVSLLSVRLVKNVKKCLVRERSWKVKSNLPDVRCFKYLYRVNLMANREVFVLVIKMLIVHSRAIKKFKLVKSAENLIHSSLHCSSRLSLACSDGFH